MLFFPLSNVSQSVVRRSLCRGQAGAAEGRHISVPPCLGGARCPSVPRKGSVSLCALREPRSRGSRRASSELRRDTGGLGSGVCSSALPSGMAGTARSCQEGSDVPSCIHLYSSQPSHSSPHSCSSVSYTFGIFFD